MTKTQRDIINELILALLELVATPQERYILSALADIINKQIPTIEDDESDQ